MDRKWTTEDLDALRSGKERGLSYSEIANSIDRTSDACKRKSYKVRHFVGADHPAPTFVDMPRDDLDIDSWLEQLSTIQSFTLRARPVTTVAEVRLKTDGRPIAFVQTSCWHLGGLYTAYAGFRERLESLLNIDRCYWGSLGDEWEGFPPGWAATVFNNLVPPSMQKILVWKIIEKLASKGKLLYSCWSNHPAFTEKITGEDESASMYYKAGVPYFNAKGILKLFVDDEMYVFDIAHSFKGSSELNPNHAQGREFRIFPYADFVISGHKHAFSYQEYHTNTAALDAGLAKNGVTHLVSVGAAKTLPDPYTVRSWQRSRWEFETWPTFILSAKAHRIARVHDEESLIWHLARDDF